MCETPLYFGVFLGFFLVFLVRSEYMASSRSVFLKK